MRRLNDQKVRVMQYSLACLILLAGCSAPIVRTSTPTLTPAPTSAPSPTPQHTSTGRLNVSLRYPKPDTAILMGQAVTFIVQIADEQGNAVNDGQVTVTVHDSAGKVMAEVPTAAAGDGVYRAGNWAIPHRMVEGTWSAAIQAKTSYARGEGSGSFQVKNSTSEILLNKYGFWLDAPALRGINPQLVAERGDAQNGMIRWGGQIPGMHVLRQAWVEVHWRASNYKLDSPEAVRRFMLDEIGDFGFTPIRAIGPFQPMTFKHWDAWRVTTRGQFQQDHVEFIAFYAPEVDKTYAMGTTVNLMPADAHAVLRSSFEVSPDVHASGVAPEPLPRRLPAPELLSPSLGTRFVGTDQPIVLQWKPVKELSKDEYYEVDVDYNWGEDNPVVTFTTQQTQIALPATLIRTPNCGVFNWEVTLKRQTGVNTNGQPLGEALSYTSLYAYLQWTYPPGEQPPFAGGCPNAQF